MHKWRHGQILNGTKKTDTDTLMSALFCTHLGTRPYLACLRLIIPPIKRMANQTRPTTKAIKEKTPKNVNDPVVFVPVGAVYHKETTPLKELLITETMPVTMLPNASKTTLRMSILYSFLSSSCACFLSTFFLCFVRMILAMANNNTNKNKPSKINPHII